MLESIDTSWVCSLLEICGRSCELLQLLAGRPAPSATRLGVAIGLGEPIRGGRPNAVRKRPAFAALDCMESKVAKEAERSLIEATQRLSPEERLNAYLEHCRLMMELYEAGQRIHNTRDAVVDRD